MTLAPWAPMVAPPLPTTDADRLRCIVLSPNPTPGKHERGTAHRRMLAIANRDGYASIRNIEHVETTDHATIDGAEFRQDGVWVHEYRAQAHAPLNRNPT